MPQHYPSHVITNETLGYPPEGIPTPPQVGPTPQPFTPQNLRAPQGITYQQLIDAETAPWVGAYQPRTYHTPEAIQQRELDMKKFERRLKIVNTLDQMRRADEQARFMEWYRQQMLAQRRETQARLDAPKPVPEGLRKQLTGLSDILQATTSVARSFKPEYIGEVPVLGIRSDIMGGIENFLKQRVPGLSEDQPNWWRDYKRLDELKARLEAFGATLSANEEKAWERSAITMGMSPEAIQRNLNTRIALSKRSLDRLQRGSAGQYDPRQVVEFGGQPIPETAARWQDPADIDVLAEEGARYTGRASGDRILSPAQRRAIEEALRMKLGR